MLWYKPNFQKKVYCFSSCIIHLSHLIVIIDKHVQATGKIISCHWHAWSYYPITGRQA